MFNNEYYALPAREIDQTIHWLKNMIADCETKISRLESMKRQDQAQARYMKKLNAMADMFDDDDFMNIDHENRVKIIFQRLDVSLERAEHIEDMLRRRAKKRAKKRRNNDILEDYRLGKNKAEIARQYNITRQTVHRVLDEYRAKKLI